MSNDDVLTLVRLARRYPDSADALLSVAERIGSNGATTQPNLAETASVSFPLEVFCIYKGQRCEGTLNQDRSLIVSGKRYRKPSPAAMSITKNSVNGWIWWWYRDPASGQIRQIRDLKERGIL